MLIQQYHIQSETHELGAPNWGAGASGAATGAAVGAAAGTIVPGVGNVVGGAVGTVVGFTAGLFGGGNQGPKRRGQKRQELARIGFTYEDISGHQDRHYTNIENFNDAGLDNMARAVQEYGEIVIHLHNAGMFNRDDAQNYMMVRQIIEENLPQNVLIGGVKSFLPMLLIGGSLAATGYVIYTNSGSLKKVVA